MWNMMDSGEAFILWATTIVAGNILSRSPKTEAVGVAIMGIAGIYSLVCTSVDIWKTFHKKEGS